MCGGCESSTHILWNCKFAKEVWKEAELGLLMLNHPTRDFVDVVWALKERRVDLDWDLFAITAWLIWNNRNSFKHEGKCKEEMRIAKEAHELRKEVQESQNSSSQGMASGYNQWRPLTKGRYKVNVDGAVFAKMGCCGVGVVIRNEEGLLMEAMSKKVHFPLGALEVEVMAVEEGIQLARDLGLGDIDMESDAQTIVLAVGGTDPGPCFIQKIVEGAKQGLSAFSSWSCSHVR
ncbi:uncharacterized protein LOC112038812 [Quercus suber]|uniref:uncharacterized protein LOC112038812 n=1 Tax=Quercus suber TaxID=58331 RepID=UPI000CE24AE3|nr:uncharacterized protein LOC112038812 [Quercus suber]